MCALQSRPEISKIPGLLQTIDNSLLKRYSFEIEVVLFRNVGSQSSGCLRRNQRTRATHAGSWPIETGAVDSLTISSGLTLW